MTILIVGNWRWPIYEASIARELRSLGYTVFEFKVSDWYFFPFFSVLRTVPFLHLGSFVLNLNLIVRSLLLRPKTIIFWRTTHFFPLTIRLLKVLKLQLVTYNNDDPFNSDPLNTNRLIYKLSWRLYYAMLPLADVNLFYRQVNVREAEQLGFKNCHIMMPGYSQALLDFAAKRKHPDKIVDITFIGHFENDGRDVVLEELAADGFIVKVFGDSTWERSGFSKKNDVFPVYGEDYVDAIQCSRICLNFNSKLNRDGYTRRCFEITALGTLLLSEWTSELDEMFPSGKAAFYFSDPNELVRQVRYLLNSPALVAEVSKNGRDISVARHSDARRAHYLSTFFGDY